MVGPMLMVLALLAGFPGVTGSPGDGIEEIEIVPLGPTTVAYDGRSLTGALSLRRIDGAITVVETVSLDDYLLGIREVPFSWPEDALAAQAVAARTYLARTLTGGPSAAGRKHGFDICATDLCQVYRGRPSGDDVERWAAAIAATAGEILVYEGRPALALYSSSAGDHTRSNQDIWGSAPLPYLQGVPSPEAGVTPFESWTVSVPADALRTILAEAGYRVETVVGARLDGPPPGEGPSDVLIETGSGAVRLPLTTARAILNRWGPRLYPGLFPGRRADGRRLPQAVPSYTFVVEFDPAPAAPVPRFLPPDDRPSRGELRLIGQGWGHGVGMSQWGAKAMADRGNSYQAILAHYYRGLRPVPGDGFVPGEVRVGLGWGFRAVRLDITGPARLLVNGVDMGTVAGGSWDVRAGPGGLALVAPEAHGLTMRLSDRRWPR